MGRLFPLIHAYCSRLKGFKRTLRIPGGGGGGGAALNVGISRIPANFVYFVTVAI